MTNRNELRWIERSIDGKLFVVELHPDGRRIRAMEREAIRRNFPGLLERFEEKARLEGAEEKERVA